MNLVDVVFNINNDQAFTYRIPEEIHISPQPGQRILAPFRNRILTGVIINLKTATDLKSVKEIIDILDDKPIINPEMLRLTEWISDYYMSPYGQTIQAAIPRGIGRQSEIYVNCNDDAQPEAAQLTEKQQFLFDIICRDPGKTLRFYNQKFGIGAVHYFLRILEKKDLVKVRIRLSGLKVKPLMRQTLTISANLPAEISGLRNPEQVLKILEERKGDTFILSDFSRQTGFSRSKIKNLAKIGLVSISQEEKVRRTRFTYVEKPQKIRLNSDQVTALANIRQAVIKKQFNVYLIHGVTGSGKTQIYLEAIKQTLDGGRTAIILIPEISLTPQTVQRFENFFPDRVAVFHSKMSPGERFDTWRKIEAGEYPIVVGPRSALFMPLQNLGMIVVDEEHDNSYKQSGSKPRYHARDAAIYRARENNAVVILGSATPSMESYYNAQIGKYELLKLPSRIKNIPMPRVTVVDMRYQRNQKGKSAIFSSLLLQKINERVDRNEQVILLQNRRGYASFIQCVACGYIPQCPHCAIALTYHSYNNALQCHYCGYTNPAGKTCAKCDGEQLKYQGSGTQKIETQLKRVIPDARILRMDQDTTHAKHAHDTYLQAFRAQKFDILLGTQMISKGLDIPNVTLVGVIAAEIGLTLPDFRAAERVFQLLTQVAGRAGRDERSGEVIIQSYLENHYAIQYARSHNFTDFYNTEIKYRLQMGYPPHNRLINIRVSGENLSATINMARDISGKLRRAATDYFAVVGPAPCPLAILNNKYRWQIMIKLHMQNDPAGKHTRRILAKQLKYYLRFNKRDTTVTIDVDPVEML